MEKKTFYFSHDYSSRMDSKIKKLLSKHGFRGYGIFWAIIEDLYNNANALPTDYDSIAYDLREDCEIIKSVINDFDLFIISNNTISSDSVKRRLKIMDLKSDSARDAALIRWEKEREKKAIKDAELMQTHSISNSNELQNECNSNAINDIKLNNTKQEETKINNNINNNIDSEKPKPKYDNPTSVSDENLQNVTKNINLSNLDYDTKKKRLSYFKEQFLQASETEKKDFCSGHKMLLERLERAINDYNLHLLTEKNSLPFNYVFYKEWFNAWLKGLSTTEFDIYMTRIRRN